MQLGTTLLTREYAQLGKPEAQLANTPFNGNDRLQLTDIIEKLRATMTSYADPAVFDPAIVTALDDIAERLLQHADAMVSSGLSGYS